MNTPITLQERIREAMVPCLRCNGTGKQHDIGTGHVLRQARNERHCFAHRVAHDMRISPQYLTDLEHDRRPWSWELVKKYLQAIGVEL